MQDACLMLQICKEIGDMNEMPADLPGISVCKERGNEAGSNTPKCEEHRQAGQGTLRSFKT